MEALPQITEKSNRKARRAYAYRKGTFMINGKRLRVKFNHTGMIPGVDEPSDRYRIEYKEITRTNRKGISYVDYIENKVQIYE